jgi:hypothetical protein
LSSTSLKYETIYDLPIRNYQKVAEDNSFKPLLIKQRKSRLVKKIDTWINYSRTLTRTWENINSQLIDHFGLSRESEVLFYKQNELNKIKFQKMLGENTDETKEVILESEINLLRSHQKDIKDIRVHHARLMRILHERYQRDPHNLTTFEFYNDLNDLQKEQETKKFQDRKKKKYG